ncbi:MAG: hypothetical protein RLZZ378_191 [Actinomycetota bacterium]
MAQPKIILFYCFTPISDPETFKLWQLSLGEQFNLKGRIIISEHGINGTLGGEMNDLKKYIRKSKEFKPFKKIDFKWSEGTGNDFPRLSVKIRPELVAFGLATELKVDKHGVVGGGEHLEPVQVNELVTKRGDDVVFFDGRNAYEAKIGKFKNAVVPNVETTKDFISELDSGKYDYLKEKAIVTYCTGGIRCEILSAAMKQRGFKEVYQINGGIVRYGEAYPENGYWEGSLYTFDGRMSMDFSPNTKVIGECEKCGDKTKQFYNCAVETCHSLILLCEKCFKNSNNLSCTHTKSRYHDAELIG